MTSWDSNAPTEGRPTADGGSSLNLRIEGMTCGSCVARVERALSGVRGVTAARVNLTTGTAVVEQTDSPAGSTALIAAVRNAGYDARIAQSGPATNTPSDHDHQKRLREHRQALIQAVAIGVPIILLELAGHTLASGEHGGRVWPVAIQAILTAVLLASSAGAPIIIGGLRAAWYRAPNMDLLVTLGVLAVFVSGVVGLLGGTHDGAHFHAAAMILGFINLGRYLETRARHATVDALFALARRMPRTAERVTPDGVATVPTETIERGDLLRVAADTTIPVDGEITEGTAAIDESAVTGEPVPQERHAGDTVRAGTLVCDGMLTVRATRVGADSTMGRIIRAVEEAQSGKMRMQRIADRVAGAFVPIVVVLAVGTFAGWMLLTEAGARAAANAAVAVVVIACPCAMGLATPTAVAVATGVAAQRGILVRDVGALERAARIDRLVLDKTGTITTGRPEVREILVCSESAQETPVSPPSDEQTLLEYAASAERFSQHPLARAIVAYTEARGINAAEPDRFRNLPGSGVEAELNGRKLLVAGPRLFRERGIDLTAAKGQLDRATHGGGTLALVAVDGRYAGAIALEDRPRPEASDAIRELSLLGIQPVMMTGDARKTAERIAAEVGIGEVYADMSPAQKQEAVEVIRRAGHLVGFVGDGINDAPALAGADVGIAFSTATDVAIGAADITIVHNDLRRLVDVVRLARRSLRVIRQNLFWAFAYNVAALPLAATGHVHPGVAAAAMMLSSLTVVTNSLRLRRVFAA
jgi:Cu+-exporting ATPase